MARQNDCGLSRITRNFRVNAMVVNKRPLVTSSGSPRRQRGPSLRFSTVAFFLGCCCIATLVASFFHGSFLLTQYKHDSPGNNLPQESLNAMSEIPPPPKELDSLDQALFGGAGIENPAWKNSATGKHFGHLQCKDFGGPMRVEETQEMVYWQDIAEDEAYISPFYDPDNPKFITFEPDHGGFNNIRMAMETVMALAIAMGRILVLPPDQPMYLLDKAETDPKSGNRGRYRPFGFQDFFPIHEMARHVHGLQIITMEEFLLQRALKGHLKSTTTGKVLFPPGNISKWDGRGDNENLLEPYLREIGGTPESWDTMKCMAAFPAQPKNDTTLTNLFQEISVTDGGFPPFEDYIGNPTSVHASTKERWKEQQNAQRGSQLCLYDTKLQEQEVLHFAGKKGFSGGRLLTHFYTFLFFEDWKTDLWMKRFVRDHVRYKNEIQCAAARIVQAIRKHVRQRQGSSSKTPTTSEEPVTPENTPFDAFHVRRGDFQYKKTRVSAQEMYEIAKEEIPEGTTVYMATDEVRDKAFFAPLAEHYDMLYLSDFTEEIKGLSPNFYGMLDQLVASRSRTFFGCWFSTFTGYINRLRGYDSDLHKRPGFAHGIVNSYYYALADKKYRMREYWPISGSHFAREFPLAWRNIDHGIAGTSGPDPASLPGASSSEFVATKPNTTRMG